jgi:hypothetical protein
MSSHSSSEELNHPQESTMKQLVIDFGEDRSFEQVAHVN